MAPWYSSPARRADTPLARGKRREAPRRPGSTPLLVLPAETPPSCSARRGLQCDAVAFHHALTICPAGRAKQPGGGQHFVLRHSLPPPCKMACPLPKTPVPGGPNMHGPLPAIWHAVFVPLSGSSSLLDTSEIPSAVSRNLNPFAGQAVCRVLCGWIPHHHSRRLNPFAGQAVCRETQL